MRRRGKYRGGDGGSLWISFSDLMSALMLIFVLVLFYAVYQYYDMLEVKTAELLRQSGLLDEKSSKLSLSQQELEEKENALACAAAVGNLSGAGAGAAASDGPAFPL